MTEQIFGIFNSVDDVRSALGEIKKATWNKADLSVFYKEQSHQGGDSANYEFAMEGFIGDNGKTVRDRWPGLKVGYLEGIGTIRCGSLSERGLNAQLKNDQLKWIKKELDEGKIVTVIETQSEVAPQLRMILENNGAKIISGDGD